MLSNQPPEVFDARLHRYLSGLRPASAIERNLTEVLSINARRLREFRSLENRLQTLARDRHPDPDRRTEVQKQGRRLRRKLDPNKLQLINRLRENCDR